MEAQGVKIEEVLFDTREFPLTRDGLYEFLSKQQAQENLEFWLEAQAFKEHTTGEQVTIRGKPCAVPLSPNADPEDPKKWSRKIVQEWIGDKATKCQLNISGTMAHKIIVEAEQDKVPDFSAPQKETIGMMALPFATWVRQQFERNMDAPHTQRRWIIGSVLVIFTTFLGLLLQYTAVQQNLLPRWGLYILLLPFSFVGCMMMVTAYYRL